MCTAVLCAPVDQASVERLAGCSLDQSRRGEIHARLSLDHAGGLDYSRLGEGRDDDEVVAAFTGDFISFCPAE